MIRGDLSPYALVSVEAAFDVADFLNRMIPTHCPRPNVTAWEAVRDALYALTNDTACIVTDPADIGIEEETDG